MQMCLEELSVQVWKCGNMEICLEYLSCEL